MNDFISFNGNYNTKNCKFLHSTMLPEEYQPIEAKEVVLSKQYLQPYFEHLLWSEFCYETCVEEAYMNVIEKKLVCGECYRTKLTFFEREGILNDVDSEATTIIYNNK